MSMNIYFFSFNNKLYGIGTVVEIYEDKRKDFEFNKFLVFDKCEDNLYYFHLLHDSWTNFAMTSAQMQMYIKEIASAAPVVDPETQRNKRDPAYIEGIVSAWIIYIVVMIFALVLKGFHNTIMCWGMASAIFWTWRRNKINGG